jgi:S-adenosylmethionine hydrolase
MRRRISSAGQQNALPFKDTFGNIIGNITEENLAQKNEAQG